MIDDSNLKSCVKNAKHFKVFEHWNSSEQFSSSVVKHNFSVKIFNLFAESECCFFLLINFHSLNRSRQKSKFISNLKPRKRSVFVFRIHQSTEKRNTHSCLKMDFFILRQRSEEDFKVQLRVSFHCNWKPLLHSQPHSPLKMTGSVEYLFSVKMPHLKAFLQIKKVCCWTWKLVVS